MRDSGKRNYLLVFVLFFAAAGSALADNPSDLAGVRFAWPLPHGVGQVASPFGPVEDPETGAWVINDSVDIAALAGTPVLCPLGGVVVSIGMGPLSPSGAFVIVKHLDGELWTTYEHLLTVEVDSGDTVRAGERLGTVGRTGNATEYSLGLKVYISSDNTFADPLWFLQDSMPSAVREWYQSREQ